MESLKHVGYKPPQISPISIKLFYNIKKKGVILQNEHIKKIKKSIYNNKFMIYE